MSLTFNMLLKNVGIDPTDVCLLRHQKSDAAKDDTPYSLWLDSPSKFDTYQNSQSTQNRSKLKSKYWANFVATSNSKKDTLFVGLWEVSLLEQDTLKARKCPLTGLPDGRGGAYDHYDNKILKELEEYIGRLSIDWGEGARAWIQRAKNQEKPIIELNRKIGEKTFPGFKKFKYQISEIEKIPADWKTHFRNTKGVYLLTCRDTGKQYIGSASGRDGFLGRWIEYATNKHGGNTGLKEHNHNNYQVSVLETVNAYATEKEIIDSENYWKEKILSRDFGLNKN